MDLRPETIQFQRGKCSAPYFSSSIVRIHQRNTIIFLLLVSPVISAKIKEEKLFTSTINVSRAFYANNAPTKNLTTIAYGLIV